MRRREKDSEGTEPAHLLHYNPDDWVGAPGVDCNHPECAYWEARTEWTLAHPGEGPIVVDGPDVPWHPQWG